MARLETKVKDRRLLVLIQRMLKAKVVMPDGVVVSTDEGVPQGGPLLRYLDGLRRSDETLRILMAGLEEQGSPAVLGFYGDHLPSLPQAYAHFGFDEPHSDYVVWPGETGIAPRLCDLPAHRLGAVIVDALLGPERAAAAALASSGDRALDLRLADPTLAFQARGQ